MSSTPARTSYKQVLTEQLHHPLKLRLCLSVCIVLVWYFCFFGPLSEQIAATSTNITMERKRLACAREIEQLKKAIAPHKGLIPGGSDVHGLMQKVMEEMRASPLKLVDLKPEKHKDLGPYEALGIRLTLQGRFADIDELLNWVETDKRLLRVDSIKMEPSAKDPSQLTAMFVLMTLGEKPDASLKTRSEPGKRP